MPPGLLMAHCPGRELATTDFPSKKASNPSDENRKWVSSSFFSSLEVPGGVKRVFQAPWTFQRAVAIPQGSVKIPLLLGSSMIVEIVLLPFFYPCKDPRPDPEGSIFSGTCILLA